MNLFEPRRNLISIYINALCNIHCKYCYINKNPALKKLDNLIEEALKTDYYVNLVNEIYKDHSIPEIFEIWGGEPFLSFERVIPTYKELLNQYPNLNRFTTSTNLSYDSVVDKIEKLFNIYKKYQDRNFNVFIQVSIDGQEDITDDSRGAGITKKVIDNFQHLIDKIPDILPDNVVLRINTKPTINVSNFDKMMNHDYLIEHFQFFESNFLDKVNKLNNPRVIMNPAVFNIAIPYHFTQEDGIKFKEICKMTRKIELENKEKHYFKYYTHITPFYKKDIDKRNKDVCKDCYSLSGGICGTGIHTIGLLPNNYLSACHRAFTGCVNEFYDNMVIPEDIRISEKTFKINSSQMVFNKYDLVNYVKKVDTYYDRNSLSLVSTLAILIQIMAISGQIDEQYKTREGALKGARFMATFSGTCLYNNESETGSISSTYSGDIKLFLNGAREYIMGEKYE